MSIVATIVWLINKNWRSEADDVQRQFPPRLPFNLFSLFLFSVSLAFFGLDLADARLNEGRLLYISSSSYTVSIVIYYILIVLSEFEPPRFEDELSKGAKDLASEVQASRSQS